MAFTALVSDSTASLDPAFVAEHNIRVIPLYIKMGEETLRDGVDITPDVFYQRLPNTSPLPTTSQPSAGDFLTVYRELVSQGASGIISVHLSSGISGTINSATLAAEQVPEVPIRIMDTRCAVGAHRFAVEAAALALKRGATMDEAVARCQAVIDQQKTIFAVDTLEYLYKGGRIGGAAALMGSLLQFKPLLYFQDGKIDALERVRKSSKALERMVEIMVEWVQGQGPVRVILMHAACPERAEAAAELLRQKLTITDLCAVPLSPVIGAHVGNGTLGICCCPEALFQG